MRHEEDPNNRYEADVNRLKAQRHTLESQKTPIIRAEVVYSADLDTVLHYLKK